MKKFVTLLLTAALAVTAATTAFADDTATQIVPGPASSPTPASGDMNVTYTVAPSYSVTIPAKVTLGSENKQGTATVEANGVTIPKGQAVRVKLNTDFRATYDADKNAPALTYQVAKANSTQTFGSGDTVLEVESGSGSTALTFALVDVGSAKYSGSYTGTVTFTVSVN